MKSLSAQPSKQSRGLLGHQPLQVSLAIALGLGSGLVLAMPLAHLLSSQPLRGNPSLINPFASWGNIAETDLLLLGIDEGGSNTDVIATLRIDGGDTKITQVPRDTYIESPRFGATKINALYALGGINALKQELSSRLGRPMQHHLIIKLSAIRRLADQIGGIEVVVPKRMAYSDRTQNLFIDLQPGRQLLKGHDLEGFLRFRHDEFGDIGRLERQKLALKALFRKLTSPEVLVQLPSLLMGSSKDIISDLGPMELGGLITSMGSTQLSTHRLGGRPFELNGISYWDTEWPQHDAGSSASASSDAAQAAPSAPSSRFLF
ncbi:MAG: LCP family protein [Synechococcaceae cyanobacterium]|nr:LCP family protein [Synechococcaceae cyanobacterium]